MKLTHSILIGTITALTTCIASAGLGDTYAQSCRQYGSRGLRRGDSVIWRHGRFDIEEGFNGSGRCAILVISRADVRYPLTLQEVQETLRKLLPAGHTWVHYGDNDYGYPEWSVNIGGTQWYALFYASKTWSRATGPTYTTFLRIATAEQLVGRGYATSNEEPTATATDITRM
ncbi:MAG: hypothetical protein JO331_03960 [Verrucomicrobia bacterium]|nr:hypothetical protein [Verrucomicrobiota bacterium]